jgi:nicotinamidase/pyrazinamidase
MPCFDLVVATQDWHPRNHQSFASQHQGMAIGQLFELHGLPQVAWPDHCVMETHGSEFVASLDRKWIHEVVQKGMDPDVDSYSGFFDNGHRRETGLTGILHKYQIASVAIMGLATDYCVRFTALDAIGQGFETYLIEDACRGVELQRGDIEKAIQQMKVAGVKMTDSNRILQ